MALAFSLPVDIANVGLEALGVDTITAADFASPVTKGGRESSRCYDKLRVAELRRNVWRFATRRVILRPIDTATCIWTPPAYSAAATYAVGAVTSYNGDYYQAQSGVQVGDIPDTAATWLRYFGPLAIDPFFLQTTQTGSGGYYPGELVIIPEAWAIGNAYLANTLILRTGVLYVSLSGNTGHDPAASTGYWTPYVGAPNTVPSLGPFVYSTFGAGPQVYLSLVSGNTVFPSGSATGWLAVNGTLATLQILYPIGSGPLSQATTPNVFRLPNGYLRQAPTDPKGQFAPAVGGPAYNQEEDYLFEGNYIVSSCTSLIMLRFVADVIDVMNMDPMFCEGLGQRMGWTMCEAMTQAKDKKDDCAAAYKLIMGEARAVNGIETGTVDPAEDEYLMVRL